MELTSTSFRNLMNGEGEIMKKETTERTKVLTKQKFKELTKTKTTKELQEYIKSLPHYWESSQGLVYKNEEAWDLNSDDIIVYIPEYGIYPQDQRQIDWKDGYSKKDILTICYNNEFVSRWIFDLLDWQSPETLFEEISEDYEFIFSGFFVCLEFGRYNIYDNEGKYFDYICEEYDTEKFQQFLASIKLCNTEIIDTNVMNLLAEQTRPKLLTNTRAKKDLINEYGEDAINSFGNNWFIVQDL